MSYAAIAVVAALVISLSINKSIWTDEAASLFSAHLGWNSLWRQSEVTDRVFLPYYALLHIWLLVKASLVWARILSLLAYAVTTYLVGRVGNRLGGLWCGVASAVLCASNPLLVQSALDVRPYALTALTATLSAYFLLRWIESEESRWLWCFAGLGVLTLALHLFAVLAPLGALVGAFALCPKSLIKKWQQLVAPVGLLVVASVVVGAYTAGQRGQISWIGHFSAAGLIGALAGPINSDSSLGHRIYGLVVFVFLVGVVVIFVRGRSKLRGAVDGRRVRQFAVLVGWAILPTIALVIVSVVKPIFVARYVTASTPGLSLALGLLLVRAVELRQPGARRDSRFARVLVAGTLIVLAFALVTVSRYEDENVRQASIYLASNVGSSGVVAYPDGVMDEEFSTYLNGRASLWPLIEHPTTFNTMDLQHTTATFAPSHGNVWVVYDSSDTMEAKKFIKLLVRHGYVFVGQKRFPGHESITIGRYRP